MIGDTRLRVALFLAAVVAYATGSFWGLPSGKAVAGGLAILDGGVPYRDFWAMYAPGQFYAVAAVFWLFGRELLVQAIAVAAIRAASSVVFFVLLRRIGAPRYAALCLSAVFVLMFWETGPELTDYPPALLFILLALDQGVQYFSGSGINHLRWAGLWLGLASWFKHDVAAYVALGMASSVLLSWVTVPRRSLAGWVAPARAILTLAACAMAACAPLLVWTAWSAGVTAWNDLVVFPATVFSKVRGNQFPPLIPAAAPFADWLSDPGNVMLARSAAEYLSTWIVLNAPLLAFLVGVFVVLVARRRLDQAGLSRLWLFLACMPWFWLAAHVQHNTHPYSLGILSAGVGIVVWSRSGSLALPARLVRIPIVLAVSIYAGGLMAQAALDGAQVSYEWPGSRMLDLPGFRGVRVPARLYEAFHPIGRFFREQTREGEPVFTGLVRHDSIVINNTLLYAIVGRPPCCRYTELHPGVADRALVQQEIIRSLEDRRVRAIVLWEFEWPEADLAARKARARIAVPDVGSTLLDQYIAERFRLVESHGEYRVLWRRDEPFPNQRQNAVDPIK